MEHVSSFEQLSLSKPLMKAIQEQGYESPSSIQAEAIPLLSEGHDLIGQAQTGTGKTAAFALPLLNKIEMNGGRAPRILVLTPTRELAIQVSEAFQKYARHLKNFYVLPIYGGQGYGFQLKRLREGTHVVVGTPGRVLDHLGRGTLVLDDLEALVLDEADEMLRMGFIEDIEQVMEVCPKDAQIAMFSATMPKPIQRIANRFLKDPKIVKIAAKTATVENIEQSYLLMHRSQKLPALIRLLEVEDYDGVLIFVRTKSATVEIAEHLEARGIAASALNGDMKQMVRERTVKRLKEKKLDIVVATDVAARGLDVDRLSLVINFDIPYDPEPYVHRIGRTGRAGRTGKAILLITPKERRLLREIERATRQKIEQMQLPTEKDIEERRIAQFKQQIVATYASQDLNFYKKQVKLILEEMALREEDLLPALLYLAQKEQPLRVDEKVSSLLDRSESNDDYRDGDRRRPRRREREGRRDREGRSRSHSDERPERKRRGDKEERKRTKASAGFDLYRMNVGRVDGLRPADIVGAIANETGLQSKFMGEIKIKDEYATIELPKGMPHELYNELKNIHLMNKKANISLQK